MQVSNNHQSMSHQREPRSSQDPTLLATINDVAHYRQLWRRQDPITMLKKAGDIYLEPRQRSPPSFTSQTISSVHVYDVIRYYIAVTSYAILFYYKMPCMHAVCIPVPDEAHLGRNHGRAVYIHLSTCRGIPPKTTNELH